MADAAGITKKREDSIDLIRAVAIVSVLVYHYTARYLDTYLNWHYTGYRFVYGSLGVELFFILSGYCIYLTITRSRSLADFFAKRLSRLWPALIVAATVTFLFVHVFGLPGRGSSVIKYVSNLLFLNVLTDHYVDGVYWTLTIEVKFYFWFGLFYFLDKKNIAAMWSFFSLAAILVSSVSALFIPYGFVSHALRFLADYVLIYPYAVWFLVGIVIYEWDTLSWERRLFLLLPAALSIGMTMFSDWIEALTYIAFVIGCVCIIPIKGMTIPGPIRFIGLVSYPLYLVHQFVGIIVIRELPGIDPYIRIILASAIVTAIAAFIHYAVEWRFRGLFRRYIYNALAFIFSALSKRIASVERFLEFPLS